MKKIIFNIAILFAFSSQVTNAQILRTSIVEHFTNTSCSICATNNNGFYSTINSHPGTLHISFHPSSPYVNDIFNQQNQAENDARTNFYGVYGATPRLVVNGAVIPYTTLNSVLTNAASATTNFELKTYQNQTAPGSFQVRIVVRKIAADTLTTALLFAGAMEDTIYQTTNNGETAHYNVFRKSLTVTIGNLIQLPSNIGDSLELNFGYVAPVNWNLNRMHAIAILQKTNKTLINSSRSENISGGVSGIDNSNNKLNIPNIFPNPAKGNIVYADDFITELSIFNVSGKLMNVLNNINKNEPIALNTYQSGIYFLKINSRGFVYYQKLIIL